VAALPIILADLRARGYSFVTVGDLFGAPDTCDGQRATRWFSSAGIRSLSDHAIYSTWQDLYCTGVDLGPATSREYSIGRWLVRQNFSRTAHRIVWDRRTGKARVTLVWSWAIGVFSARRISPEWHTAITTAWFEQFFRGVDWGPAMSPPHRSRHGVTVQRFLYGRAKLFDGKVIWRR
jgi:hypothetical protein